MIKATETFYIDGRRIVRGEVLTGTEAVEAVKRGWAAASAEIPEAEKPEPKRKAVKQ